MSRNSISPCLAAAATLIFCALLSIGCNPPPQSSLEQPVDDGTATDDTGGEAESAGDTIAGDSTTDDTATDQTAGTDAASDETAGEDTASEDAAADDAATDAPPTDAPATADATTEDTTMPEAATSGDAAATEEPADDKPAGEGDTTEPPATPETPAGTDAAAEPAVDDSAAAANPLATPLKKAELLAELPDKWNTPDGMCLLPNGNVLVSVPNVNDPKYPAVIICVTPDNQVEEYYTVPLHPETDRAFPFGICVDPEGENLYLADLQWFADPENPNYLSRVLRIPLKDCKPVIGDDGQPVAPEVVVEGMVVANAVVVRDGFLYVSDTLMVPGTDPVVTGIYKIGLDEARPVKLVKPLEEDPHLIAKIPAFNTEVGFGADGLTFDSKGNLFCGNFADGTLHKIEFDDEGNVKSNTICAKVPYMRSCDGIFCDLSTDEIYIADSLANAVQIYRPDGTVQTLAVDEENDGSGGRLDQPCEVLLRGREVIVSNMDFPVPTGVNTKFDKPYTLSVIKLDE